jgi:quercetin dioxygenase-like cupin family protein
MSHDSPINAQAVLTRDNLKVMRIKIAKGAALAEHSTHTDAIVTVIKGKGTFTIKGKPRAIVTGDVIDLQPNDLHAVSADEELELIVIKMQLASHNAKT